MAREKTIARKRLSAAKTARLIVDESPPDPRAGGSAMTTIVAATSKIPSGIPPPQPARQSARPGLKILNRPRPPAGRRSTQ